MKYVLYLILAFLFFNPSMQAQQDIAIGDWRSYTSFKQFIDVTQSDKYVYAACERGLLKIDKTEETVEKITKVDGLSDTEPNNISFDQTSNTLVIAYKNGNIDLLNSDGIFNMPNIFNNSNIIISKTPNRTRLDDESHAYIAYDFGLVQLNLDGITFGFSLLTDFVIHDFVKLNDRFYFSSDDGVYWADANPNINHADLSVWTRFNEGWPVDYFSNSIAALNGRLYCDVNGDLMEIVNENPVLVKAAVDDYAVRTISALNEHLAVSFKYNNPNGGFKIDELFFLSQDGDLLAAYTQAFCSIVVYNIIQTQDGKIYYANDSSLRTLGAIGETCGEITTLGPNKSDAFEVTFRGHEVIVATGSISDKNVVSFIREGIYFYKDGVWDQFNHQDGFYGDSVIDYTDVAVGPNQELVIGNFFEGVIKVTQDYQSAELFNEFSSCLEAQELIPDVVSVSDLKYDNQGNLWIANYRSANPVKMIDTEGNCQVMVSRNRLGSTEPREFTFDERGYIWFTTGDSETGMVVYDPAEDRIQRINANNSELEDNLTWDIVTDLDGDIWVGTETGALVFECGSSIFDSGCSGRRPIVEVDGVPALLLENERVRAVAIDGANRKWFGTNNGIFVQSPNGEEEVLHFNERNSPLISDFIRDIAINPLSGEVWIATDKGLMSYRTDATLGDENFHADESEVFAFPNPVRPEYDGPIAIKGLPRDARVKITDIQGKLIFEGEANGGQAIWNGRDYNGRKASSGVYLVFSTSQETFAKPDALVSKILIVK